MCSVKGTLPFLGLTILVNFTWLFLAVANLHTTDSGQPDPVFKKLGGVFGLMVALTAWYNMYVGMATKSNRYVKESENLDFTGERFSLTKRSLALLFLLSCRYLGVGNGCK